VIDAASQAVLQEVLRRERLSFLAYIGDAFPWATAADMPGLDILKRLIRQETDAVTSLGRFLVRHKVPQPFVGSYPAAFTSCNFIALSYLVPRLLGLQKQSVAELQADVAKVQDQAAKQELERLLGVKKMTLAGLETLAASSPAPASA
jgi:hypothetical protein